MRLSVATKRFDTQLRPTVGASAPGRLTCEIWASCRAGSRGMLMSRLSFPTRSLASLRMGTARSAPRSLSTERRRPCESFSASLPMQGIWAKTRRGSFARPQLTGEYRATCLSMKRRHCSMQLPSLTAPSPKETTRCSRCCSGPASGLARLLP